MVARSNGGITLLRRYRRLLSALDALLESKVISAREHGDRKKLVVFLYDQWRESWRKGLPPGRGRGRPKIEDRSVFKVCKRAGCGKPPAKDQCYCSPDHAPYAELMFPERKKRKQ